MTRQEAREHLGKRVVVRLENGWWANLRLLAIDNDVAIIQADGARGTIRRPLADVRKQQP